MFRHDPAVHERLVAASDLRAAAQAIDTHGHAKHALRTADGELCALGAILHAIGATWTDDHPITYDHHRFVHARLAASITGHGFGGLVRWNNAPDTTGPQVAAHLRECANRLEAEVAAGI